MFGEVGQGMDLVMLNLVNNPGQGPKVIGRARIMYLVKVASAVPDGYANWSLLQVLGKSG